LELLSNITMYKYFFVIFVYISFVFVLTTSIFAQSPPVVVPSRISIPTFTPTPTLFASITPAVPVPVVSMASGAPVSQYSNSQFISAPGKNCGIPDANNGTNSKNACCISTITQFGIDPSTGSNIPVIGDLVSGIADSMSKFIDKVPFSFFPDEAVQNLHLPTWGNLKTAISGVKPCIEDGIPTPKNVGGKSMCFCKSPEGAGLRKITKLCDMITNPTEVEHCRSCVVGTYAQDADGKDLNYIKGVWTSIGCINTTSPKDFIEKTVFGLGIGLAGTVSLFCIIYAAFQVQLSQGNPEKLKKSQEMMTSCITGLILILFSIFILRVIGVDILRLPGLK
jgi:hypothetical protein